MQYVHINPNLPIFRQQPQLKKAVYISINRAIQDVIAPVVDRLVMIASITTRELVLKDFAMESDENKMLKASFSMVQSLAGNLASITCKDPLRAAIMNNLRSTLGVPPGKPIPAHLEHAIQTIVADNLELACTVVQKAAAEAATSTTEEQLGSAVHARKTHREKSGRRMPFYDINFVGSAGYAFVATLPEYLRPKLGGISSEQLQVYEDFPAAPHAVPPSFGTAGYQATDLRQPGILTPTGQTTGAGPASAAELSLEQVAKRMDQFVVELLNALSLLQGVRSLSELNQDHVVVRMFSRVPAILMSTQSKYELAAYTAQLVFPKLFERTLLHREAFLTIIDALVSAVPAIRPKITELLVFSEPAQKFHHEVVPALLHYNMLSIAEYDAELAEMIVQRNPIAIEFANFLYQSMIKATALNASDLILTLETLLRVTPTDVELRSLVESVRGTQLTENYGNGEYGATYSAPGQATYEEKPVAAPQQRYDAEIYHRAIPPTLERQVVVLFDEWMTIYQVNDMKVILNFMRQLQQGLGFYAAKEVTDIDVAVYQVCVETAIYRCLTTQREPETEEDNLLATSESVGIAGVGVSSTGASASVSAAGERTEHLLNYKPIEASAKLLFQMIRYAPNKIASLNIVLNVIGRVMHSNYQSEYDQRPYFKLFVSLLMEFNILDPVLEPYYVDIYLEVCFMSGCQLIVLV